MVSTPFSSVSPVRPVQRKNASSPMLVTLPGTVTPVSALQ